ncbi:MAG: MBL fold metallo-hydrolase [Lachnospiraceae bacterium]|nr:MBL fold metallo-hydrolase [Lachnospiraceae bacterium]
MKEYKPHFSIKEIYPDSYVITDYGVGQGKVYMYLLAGSEKALLIDSGYGLLNLKDIVGSITDKPVICVCTHGHLDHALGASQFEEAYLHSGDFEVYERHTSYELITDAGLKGILMKPPKAMRNNPSYIKQIEKMAQKHYSGLKALDEIKKIDLGGRTASLHHVPGHTPGSIAIIDETYNTIFDADASAPGAFLFLPESSPLLEYGKMLRDYLSFMEMRGIENRYVGHSSKAVNIKHLKRLIRCVEIAIAKPNKGIKINSVLGKARLVFAGGSLIFCGRQGY